MNITDKIIAYECGDIDEAEVLELFAELIRTGMAWQLQGHYKRVAYDLIDGDYIDTNGNITNE